MRKPIYSLEKAWEKQTEIRELGKYTLFRKFESFSWDCMNYSKSLTVDL